MLSLGSHGLTRIASMPLSKDFEFDVGGHKYFCQSAQAVFISPLIAKIKSEDILASSFTISINDSRNQFQSVMDLMNGQELSLSDQNLEYLILVATKLQNNEMLSKLFDFKTRQNPLNISNVISRIEQKSLYDLDATQEIDYLASHLSEIPELSNDNKFMCLPPSILELIFKSPNLKVLNESWLFELILSIVHFRGESCLFLFGSLYLEFLSDLEMSTLLQEISPDDIGGDFWQMIRNRLSLRVFPKSDVGDRHLQKNILINYDKQNGEYLYSEGHPFEGIISYLTTQYGENIHSSGGVEIVASSFSSPSAVLKVVDRDFNGFWISDNKPDQWLKFDFKVHSIILKGYSLKTRDGSRKDAHLKSWILEGSNDGIIWEEIDKRLDTKDLDNNFAVHYYECESTSQYRMIRLRQIGPNHRGDNHMVLNHIEFFGILLSS